VVSATNTTIDAAPASVVADGLSSSTITVQAKDSSGNNITVSAGTVTLASLSGTAVISAVNDIGNGAYTATVTNTVAEVVTITGTIAGDAITDNAVVTFTPSNVPETLGVYSESHTDPVLPYSSIINAADFGGNATIPNEFSTAVAPLDGDVVLQALFLNSSQSYGGIIFDFTTTTGGGTNLLTNQSFELPDASGGDQGGCAGGDLAGWSYFNCNYISSNTRNNNPPGTYYSPGAHDGSQLLKQFGGDAGIFQTIAAAPGETINASAYAMSWSGDAFNNVGLLQIFFLDAGGNNISGGYTPFAQVVAAAPAVGGTPDYVLSPQDGADLTDWTLMEVSAVAPAGTVEAKVQIIHILESTTPSGGALWLDDISLSKSASVVTGGDISNYDTLKFGIDTSVIGTFADLKVQLEDGTVTPGVFLSAYTPTVSANWEIYDIPLSDFTGLNKSNLTYMGFWNASSVAGAESPLVFGPLYFDDIYFVKSIPTEPVLTGVLLDSPVEGVTFQTATQSGVTNVAGEFQYQAGEMVTFSIGDIVLGTVQGADIITAVELTGSFDPTDQAATNLLVFLQSIDEDQNFSNGITISAATQAAAVGQALDFNLSSSAFTAAVTTVVNAITEPDNAIVSETTALDNFYLTYADLGGTNTFTWLFPGYPQVGEPGYDLIWSDEFNAGSSPDVNNWTMETGYGDNGWGNNEWQLYTTSPDNVRVENGNLVITADCPTAPVCGVRDGTVTSGRINTLNKFEFKYGKIQARIKPPVGLGSWPAFWMLGANYPDVGWPFSGEIDVMEIHNAYSDENTSHFTMHWCDQSKQNPATPDICYPGNEGWTYDSQFITFAESLGNDFHIFEADWDSGQMIGKIDGITYFTLTIDPVNMDEFLKEFFVILNVAMGGTLGSADQPPSGLETWPQTMLVDYVRVYQLTGGDGTYTIGGGGSAGPNLLTNQSFELPDASGGDQGGCAGGDLAGWSYFNCNYISSNTRNNNPPGTYYSPGAHDGSQLLKQFGGDAGVFQTIAAAPGDTVNASAYAMSWSGDAFNNVGLLQIFFLDAGGNNISGGYTPFVQVVAAAPAVGGTPDYVLSPQDGADLTDWTLMEVSAVAPAGTVEAKIQMIHILESTTPAGGALWWDDASLSVTN
jgi:beta-glucanase (GH16 family)